MTVTAKVGTATPASGGIAAETLGKVAFVVSQFPETHETFILREFTGLKAAGLDFVILSLKPCRDKIIQKDALAFVNRTYYPFGRNVPALRVGETLSGLRAAGFSVPWWRVPHQCAYVTWAAGRFAALGRELGISHIHAHWATAPTSAALIMSKALGIPYSFTAHAWDIYAGDGCLAAKARGAKFVATCTKANVDHIRRLLPEDQRGKVVLNYHGIPLDSIAPKAADGGSATLKIAAAGRLVETKGFAYLLRALERLSFPFQLTIVGDGPLRRTLEKTAASVGIAQCVRFTGTISNEEVFETLAASDVFVMPSVVGGNGDRDGIPNVLLEAMAAGLPVIASRISGIPEVVIHGKTGILVREKDVQGIRSALERLYGAHGEARKLGQAGADFVKAHFCAQKNAHSLFAIFRGHLGFARA